VPSSISFRSKPDDFVPCLNILKVVLPVPEGILPPLCGKIFESRGSYLEDICWMGEQEFAGWIGARNNCERTPEVMKSPIPPGIIHSISNRNRDKRRFRV
jgi:hypothetical protein